MHTVLPVVLHLYGERTEGEGPEISGWSVRGEGKNREYSCRVTFSADGEYAFTVACQDLAGNRADYDRVDRFTIDRTAPEAEILWSGAEAGNGFYYPGERIAKIRIRERNFTEEVMEIRVEEQSVEEKGDGTGHFELCLLYTSSIPIRTEVQTKSRLQRTIWRPSKRKSPMSRA